MTPGHTKAVSSAGSLDHNQLRQSTATWHAVVFLILFSTRTFASPSDQLIQTNQQGRMTSKQYDVNYIAAGQVAVVAPTNQWLAFGDALRTLQLGRATVLFADWKQVFLRDRSLLAIVPDGETNAPLLRLLDGELYLSRGGGTISLPVEAAGTRATPKGTEFLVSVSGGTATFTMFDGEVEMINAATQQPVRVFSGEQGIAEPGQPIRKRPIVQANNIVQWWLYYPAVLDPNELSFTPAERTQLTASLAAYRNGNLVQALQRFPGFPAPNAPTTDSGRIYLAALQLSVGAIDRAEVLLAPSGQSPAPAPAQALRLMIYAVTNGGLSAPMAFPINLSSNVSSASLLLAESFAHQSTNNLRAALAAARKAVERTPEFGFARARLAELEFSFGNTRAASDAVDRALELSPQNAQAHCVHGFLLAAWYDYRAALAAFDQAIELDPFLGNAWLGRGLVKRRFGILGRPEQRDSSITNAVSWLADLQAAAAIEPRRSLVRAYAGKAFGDSGRADLALKELDYAAQLDPNDPTPSLYRSLELYEENRPNEAVRELERSIELNDNRAVYRSRLLLDQDQAVRSASLAKIYQDAGLEDVAIREAARAVSYDYSSHSAHQFLAESYNALRDPTRFNLRYETVWFNELLLANILSPVGAGLLSQNISQEEYSRLFEANRLGLTTSTEYRSDGQFREIASHYGLVDRFAYTLDLDYQRNEGTRPNNDLDRVEWYSQLKYQLTDRDSLFVLTKYQDYESGDNFQRYDPNNASRHLRLSETQLPLAMASMHREWSPGIHTTLMGARLASEQQLHNMQPVPRLHINETPDRFSYLTFTNLDYQSEFETFQIELNQVLQTERNALVFGGRYQWGEFETEDRLRNPETRLPGYTNQSNIAGTSDAPIRRSSAYGYYTLALTPVFRVTGGISYDRVEYPTNFRFPPVSEGTSNKEKVSPKAAVVWDATDWLTFRGVYSEFLGGVSLEESFRLEPSQLAGFSQAFRTVISEVEAGSVAVPEYQLGGLAVDWKPGPGTYVGLNWQVIQSSVDQEIGVFHQNGLASVTRSLLGENLDYEEQTSGVAVHQLIADRWAAGLAYHWIRSNLEWAYPGLVATDNPARTEESLLHRFDVQLTYHHPFGWFGTIQAQYFLQDNAGYPNVARPEPRTGEELWQVDLHAGIRFFRRRAELTASVLNLTDQDYRLNSLTPYPELPRERVFAARLRLSF